MSASRFIERLQRQADSAQAAETLYRREAAARIGLLEQERAFAYRRLNLLRAIVEATASHVGADPNQIVSNDEEIAVARGLAVLRSKLGWTSDSATRDATLARFTPVVVAFYHELGGNGTVASVGVQDVGAALGEFEDWYMKAHGVAFWTLFEVSIPDTPRIDF